jgi:hypothetical protein
MYYVYMFFCNHYYIYIYIIIYLSVIIEQIFSLKKFNFFFTKKKKITWVEIWNIDTKLTKLEKIENNSWNLYFKYKLTTLTSWHILEERFLIFIIIFIFII